MTSLDLMDGEAVETAANIPVMYYHRRGRDRDAPLVVFLPGGGHLARVAYGYPGGNSRDFIDFWLERAGLGLLAPSVPSGPPFTPFAAKDLTRRQWGEAVAVMIERVLEPGASRSVVILTWSLASGVIGDVASCLKARDIEIAAFIPMAASSPLPRFSAHRNVEELLRDDGLWDVAGSRVFGSTRGAAWSAELAATEARLGRTVLSAEDYRRHFWTGTPVGLKRGGMAGTSVETAPDLSLIPLAAPILPDGQEDYRHALGDVAEWSHLNTQAIVDRYARIAAGADRISDTAWANLMELVRALPEQLTARVPGGHLFFIGEPGAAAAVEAILLLRDRTEAFNRELDLLLGSPVQEAGDHRAP